MVYTQAQAAKVTKMASKPVPKSVMQRVETSKEDKTRDKKQGIKEGSPKDVRLDTAQARRMMAQKLAKRR